MDSPRKTLESMPTPARSPNLPKRRITRSTIATGFRSRWPKPGSCSVVACPTHCAWHGRRDIVGRMAGREIPSNLQEVYAKEAIYLHDEPPRELKLQAIRIGELGIAAIPNEVFAITGLKIKAQSPFETTMNIELANGSEGYIPPPEQHTLGGYTTWPARTAGLEVQAEPRIVEGVLGLLEKVADKPRRTAKAIDGPYAQAVIASRPMAFWRLDELQGPTRLRRDWQRQTSHLPRSRCILFAGSQFDRPLNCKLREPRYTLRGDDLTASSRARARITASSSGSGAACRLTPN